MQDKYFAAGTSLGTAYVECSVNSWKRFTLATSSLHTVIISHFSLDLSSIFPSHYPQFFFFLSPQQTFPLPSWSPLSHWQTFQFKTAWVCNHTGTRCYWNVSFWFPLQCLCTWGCLCDTVLLDIHTTYSPAPLKIFSALSCLPKYFLTSRYLSWPLDTSFVTHTKIISKRLLRYQLDNYYGILFCVILKNHETLGIVLRWSLVFCATCLSAVELCLWSTGTTSLRCCISYPSVLSTPPRVNWLSHVPFLLSQQVKVSCLWICVL